MEFRNKFVFKTYLNKSFFDFVNNDNIAYPQPVMSDLDFNEDGYLVMAFADRFAHQSGIDDKSPDGALSHKTGIAAGDILMASVNAKGEYTLENNGKVGRFTTEITSGNTQGPGGKEFFDDNENTWAEEGNQGSIGLILGRKEIISTHLSPAGYFSTNGMRWISTYSGISKELGSQQQRYRGYELFSNRLNGMSEVEMLCDPAPMELGGKVWNDANKDGIQDPCELPFEGINLVLYDSFGRELANTLTNGKGDFFFGQQGDDKQNWKINDKIKPTSNYYIVLKGSFDASKGQLSKDGKAYTLTKAKAQTSIASDLNDSDALIAQSNDYIGFPYIHYYTSTSGTVSHAIGFGFAPVVATQSAANGLKTESLPAINATEAAPQSKTQKSFDIQTKVIKDNN